MFRTITLISLCIFLGFTFAFGQPKLTFNTQSINFGNVKVGEYSHLNDASILIANIGTDTLKITSISFTQVQFSANQVSFTLPPGTSIIDTLHFTPTHAGLFSAWLIASSNNPTSPDSLQVMGFGLAGPVVDTKTQAYRDEPKGNVQYRKKSVMNGNRISTVYINDGEVGHWPDEPSAEWPKGTGHSYLDGTAVLIASKIAAPNGQTIAPLVSAYREVVSKDPLTGEEWVLQPIPGYANPSSQVPAVNRDTSTFPPVWPAALGLTPAWNGHWYGYFGLGISNADFETYFVMDDSKDKKWTRPPFNYYPIASDSDRGGLGLRVEVRGFQWSHVLAEDCIFWHYDIVNISDHDYDSTCFGFYTDPGVGGTNTPGNSALFDRSTHGAGQSLSLTYAWCPTCGQGTQSATNYVTGYLGYAYLESPGNPYDRIDNNLNGLIDERRDNNIDDNRNWIPYSDLNRNGKWDPGELLNDDVGRDGLGPTDPNYTGPDEGEGDGIPTHGEPDFDETDIGESDMIGLTAMTIRILDNSHGPTGLWIQNDEVMWDAMNNGFRDTTVKNSNIQMVFASGPFPLKQTKRERFSMALIFGDNLDALIFNKVTVQDIYNANYQFTKPPYTPHLTAVPSDRKVSLYWDEIAETSTDRFYGYQNGDPAQGYFKSFEGYTIYRSEEPEFDDVKKITDSQGNPKYYKPIAQFDLVDSIAGPDPVGINGARFWRGSNSGLQHAFIDSPVTNGTRYYYAVCSYSKGGPTPNGKPLQPTECSKIISQDYAGNIKFVDINCAVVIPQKPVAGYQPPKTNGDMDHVAQGLGTGSLKLTILNPVQIQEGDQYTVKFKSDTTIPIYHTTSFDIYRTRNNVTDTLILGADTASIGNGRVTRPFDGMFLSVLNDSIAMNDAGTGWVIGSSNVRILVAQDFISTNRVAWPADYEIRWDNTFVDTSAFSLGDVTFPRMPVKFHIFKKDTSSNWVRAKFIVQDMDTSGTLTMGDTIRIIDQVVNNRNFKWTWKISYGRPFGVVQEPQPGDRFAIKTFRPFLSGDYFSFNMIASQTDNGAAKTQLSQITVVPNPYFATAKWESRTLFSTGRGDRLIQFMKLPAKCTIRIYTIAGALVKTLYKNTSPMDGSMSWNLVSDDGMDIAYGLYIFHVDAPGIGQYIGKFTVVK
jgi:hypothetical protein